MNNKKTKKLSFEDLITVSGGAEATFGDKTFQHEKYNKGKKNKLQDGPEPLDAQIAPEHGLQNSTKGRDVNRNNTH